MTGGLVSRMSGIRTRWRRRLERVIVATDLAVIAGFATASVATGTPNRVLCGTSVASIVLSPGGTAIKTVGVVFRGRGAY